MDLQRFALHVEESFGVRLKEEIVAQIRTPGQLIDYVTTLLPESVHLDEPVRLADRMSMKLCDSIGKHLSLKPQHITASSSLKDLFPVADNDTWQAVRGLMGARYWPQIVRGRRWTCFARSAGTVDSPHCNTVGEVVSFLVARSPTLVKTEIEGWTRDQICEVVQQLMIVDFGLPEKDFSEESRFVDDLLLE